MTDRKLLELAPGSRWVNSVEVADSTNTNAYLGSGAHGQVLVLRDNDGYAEAWTSDVIALLHRAGLLDSLLAEAWEQGLRDWIKCACRDEYETASEQMIAEFCKAENPHRKKASDGE